MYAKNRPETTQSFSYFKPVAACNVRIAADRKSKEKENL